MSNRMRQILESKRALRHRLAALPFADKVKLLEQLRDRSRALAASPLKRKAGSSSLLPHGQRSPS
jgi:hypothetical protein